MGEVYRAEDPVLKRIVAIKRLAPRLQADPQYHQRFRREAERASTLDCRYIAAVHDVIEQDTESFLVMEYIEGTTLRAHLDQPTSLDDFFPIAIQSLEALVAAHRKGIIHRDIKPENIMLTRSHEVKILDFGLAHRQWLKQETIESSEYTTHAGVLVGTPGYMAPELLFEAEPGPAIDIYSLGVVFYEMLYARRPFSKMGIHRPPPSSTEKTSRSAVPPQLASIIKKMLERDPEERYVHAEDVLRDVQKARNALTRSSRAARLWTYTRTHRIIWVFAVVALIAAGFCAHEIWRYAHHPPPPRARIAVLPFNNQTGDASLDRVSLTLAHTLIHDLTGSPSLQVLPYERSVELTRGLQATGKDVYEPAALKALADVASARFVVVPVLFRVGTQARISAEVHDTRSQETTAVIKVERQISGALDESFYRLEGELADAVQRHFRKALGGKSYASPPSSSWPRTLTGALEYTDGKNALAQGNYARALDLFQRTIDEDPDFAPAYSRMSRIYGVLGYDDRALPLAEKARGLLRSDTPTMDRLQIQGNLAERQYDFGTAEQYYTELIQVYPDDADPYARLATVHVNQGRYLKAIADFQEALRRDPNFIDVHQQLAVLYIRTGDVSQAMEHAQRSLELCRSLENREGEADSNLLLAEIARAQSRFDDALVSAREALHLATAANYDATKLRAEKVLGDVQFSQGKLQEARLHYRNVLESSAELRNNRLVAQTLMNLGVTYQNAGDYAQAVGYYENSLAQASRFGAYRDQPALRVRGQVLTNLASILIDYGPEPERGLHLAQEAESLFQATGETEWEAWAGMLVGNAHLNAGRFSQADRFLEEALTTFRRLPSPARLRQATYNQAYAFFVENRYEAAHASADTALRLAEQSNDAFGLSLTQVLAAWIALRVGDTDEARELLATGLESAKRHGYGEVLPDAYNALGELAEESGNRAAAIAAYQQALPKTGTVTAAESNIAAQSNLARLRTDESSARAALERAYTLGHRHTIAVVALNLAQIYTAKQQYTRAVTVLNEVLAPNMGDIGGELRARLLFAQARALEGNGAAAQSERQQARESVMAVRAQVSPSLRGAFSSRRPIREIFAEPATASAPRH